MAVQPLVLINKPPQRRADGKVTIYNANGESKDCYPIDAREIVTVSNGRWTFEPQRPPVGEDDPRKTGVEPSDQPSTLPVVEPAATQPPRPPTTRAGSIRGADPKK